MTLSTTEIYRRLLATPGNTYGHGNHWLPVWDSILATEPRSILDVGCGRGGLVVAARAAGIEARGCDLAPCEPWIDQATLPVLPYGNASFDTVGCFDVLEHLVEHQVGAAIDELRRVCREHLVISIAWCSDVREIDGQPIELHLTRQPVAWWIAQCGDAEEIPVKGQPEWRHYLRVAP